VKAKDVEVQRKKYVVFVRNGKRWALQAFDRRNVFVRNRKRWALQA